MMNAILMAVVRFFETVVNWAIGAVLIAIGVIGIVAVCRWLLSQSHVRSSFGRTPGAFRSAVSWRSRPHW